SLPEATTSSRCKAYLRVLQISAVRRKEHSFPSCAQDAPCSIRAQLHPSRSRPSGVCSRIPLASARHTSLAFSPARPYARLSIRRPSAMRGVLHDLLRRSLRSCGLLRLPRYGSRPTQFILGNFAAIAASLSEADVVTLDRVVCCYPDASALLGAAAARSRRLLAFTHPPDRWYLRGGFSVVNFFLWLGRSAF